MLRASLVGIALCAIGVAGATPAAELEKMKGSVVRIVNFSQRGDWAIPWEASGVVETSGSGFVIAGGRVITNAHVVSDSRLLLIQLHNDPEQHEAEVLHIAHDCDLALVRPKSPRLLDRVRALEIGGIPELGSIVDTLGYPDGGTQLSSTRGVVSRIEPQGYVHSGADRHLAGQTDASINPGSSGGPVVQDGRVVGVAFQAAPDLENTGYFIVDEVIRRFLRDVEDGRYDGYPDLGVEVVPMENPAQRAYAGMLPQDSGVRVVFVVPDASTDNPLRLGDVILSVAGRPVANDGWVTDGKGRVPFGMLADRLQTGETLSLRVLRGDRRLDLAVPLAGSDWAWSRREAYDRFPRYFVYAGLVFVPLELELLETYGENWSSAAPQTLLHAFITRTGLDPERLREERIVLVRRLKHPVNADMAWHADEMVARVNGREITSLEALIEALESQQGDYHVIEFESEHRFGVLDRKKAEQANPEILERYAIRSDRSL